MSRERVNFQFSACVAMLGRQARRFALASLILLLAVTLGSWIWSHWTYHGLLYRLEGVRLTSKSSALADWRLSIDDRDGSLTIELNQSFAPAYAATLSRSGSRWDWLEEPLLPSTVRQVQLRNDINRLAGGWQMGGYGLRVQRTRSNGFNGFASFARVPTAAIVLPLGVVIGSWLWIAARARRLRARRVCVQCKYDLRGLKPDSPCPECGANTNSARERREDSWTAWAMGCAAWVWMCAARRRFLREARSLRDEERAALAAYFDADLLDRVRVADVERIDLPGAAVAMRLIGKGAASVCALPAGIALGDLVVIARAGRVADDLAAGDRRTSVLFHELVHVAQYRVLGVRGFLTRYVGGWLANGREYAAIPLEIQAYSLQERFDRDELEADDVRREMAALAP
jgi:hypothetical protein